MPKSTPKVPPALVLNPRELALHAARLVLDKGGEDLALFKLPPSNSVSDYAMVVTGRSDRQVHAIVDEILHFCKRLRIPHFPLEGQAGWQLIDCHDVVIHALSQEMRDFYRLDRLWAGAQSVDVEAELQTLPKLEAIGA